MSRAPESVLHELDYWRAMLEDLRAINAGVLEASSAVAGIPVELLPLLFVTASGDVTERVTGLVARTQAGIGSMQDAIDRLVALAQGRLLALQAEGFEGQAGEAA